jgi:hypothetical protein
MAGIPKFDLDVEVAEDNTLYIQLSLEDFRTLNSRMSQLELANSLLTQERDALTSWASAIGKLHDQVWGIIAPDRPDGRLPYDMIAAATSIVRERDEALAREAALVKSLVNIQEDATDTPTYGDAKAALNRIVRECEDVLSAPATVAAARDAALIERGRREGIEEVLASLRAYLTRFFPGDEKFETPGGYVRTLRALTTPPVKENDDAR